MSADGPGRRWPRVALTMAIVIALSMLASCGANLPVGSNGFPAEVVFTNWFPFQGDTAVGMLGLRLSGGLGPAKDVKVGVYYVTPAGERTYAVSPEQPQVELYFGTYFRVSPQVTNGELRFPRIGRINWNSGSTPPAPRTPALAIDSAWCFFGSDSATGMVSNRAGWAYHVVVTVNGRNGIQDVALDPGRVPLYSPYEAGVAFSTVVRDSAGLVVPPQVLKIRWEDYGGVLDSLVSPAYAHAWKSCATPIAGR